MSSVFRSKIILVAAWIVIGGGVIAGIGLIVLGSYLDGIDENLNRQWATLEATDHSIVELGDGMDVYSIDEKSLIHVGGTAIIGDIQVAILNSQEGLENSEASFEYQVTNVGHGAVRWRTSGNSHIQYVQGERASWRLINSIDCDPPADHEFVILEPSEDATCVVSYWIPGEAQAVYWLLRGEGEVEHTVFQVR